MHRDDDEFETFPDAAPSASARSGPTLKARAIAFLSRREYSRRELQRKLAPLTHEPDELESLLDTLERENWLSNERFAQSLVNRRAPRQGTQRIVQELRQHGLADAVVQEVQQRLQDTETQRALQVWEKKFGQPPRDPKDYARQFRFMASRGFSTELVRRLLGRVPHRAE
jgi:regulatory protein